MSAGWVVEPWMVADSAVLLIAAAVWLSFSRRNRDQRKLLRTIYALSEEVIAAASPAEISERTAAVLPRLLHLTQTRVYLYSRAAKALESLSCSTDPEVLNAALESPLGLIQTGVVTCFRNSALLHIPDTRESPFLAESDRRPPRSLLFAPMFAQNEVVGVLELRDAGHVRKFCPDHMWAIQHLANQIGVAVKLLQQRSVREQLSRSEKLAAVGGLISGIVNELRSPLETITGVCERALSLPDYEPSREWRFIRAEARKASEIVARLVSFAKPDQFEAKPVEIGGILRELIAFREREWKARGIQLRAELSDDPLWVLGSAGQLEQVFLNLLVHSEQCLTDTDSRLIALRATSLAKTIIVEIGCGDLSGVAGATEAPSGSGDVALSVCRGIVAGNGGELRSLESPSGQIFTIVLPRRILQSPLAEKGRVLSTAGSRQHTALLMENEEPAERQIVSLLGNRGYRVVPVHSAEEGLDLCQRLRFDVVFVSARLPGLNWVELLERVRQHVGASVFLSEGYDTGLSGDLREQGHFVLAKPIEESQLDWVLDSLEDQPARAPLVDVSS